MLNCDRRGIAYRVFVPPDVPPHGDAGSSGIARIADLLQKLPFGDLFCAAEDDDREARVSMLEAYPNLKALYSPADGNTEVWYLRNVTATLYSFTEPPVVYHC